LPWRQDFDGVQVELEELRHDGRESGNSLHQGDERVAVAGRGSAVALEKLPRPESGQHLVRVDVAHGH
jgi:hypothetical protein